MSLSVCSISQGATALTTISVVLRRWNFASAEEQAGLRLHLGTRPSHAYFFAYCFLRCCVSLSGFCLCLLLVCVRARPEALRSFMPTFGHIDEGRSKWRSSCAGESGRLPGLLCAATTSSVR